MTPLKAFFGTIFAMLLLLALFTLACDRAAIKTSQTDNAEFKVDLLFTHEGCKVYRFEDDGKHYYVVCSKADTEATLYDWCVEEGKTCKVHHEDIPTVTP